MRRNTGISLAAHSMRSLPRRAKEISLTSPLVEVVINCVILSLFENIDCTIVSFFQTNLSRAPVWIEMRIFNETLITSCNIIYLQSTQAVNTKVFTDV